MYEIKFGEQRKTYTIELTLKDYDRFLEFKFSNEDYFYVEYKEGFYSIFKPRDLTFYLNHQKFVLEFDKYFKSNNKFLVDFDYIEKSISYDLSNIPANSIKSLNNFIIEDNKYKMKFSINDNILEVIVISSKLVIESMRISSSIFLYFYFVNNIFLEQNQIITYTDKGGRIIYEYINPKYSDYENAKYSRFSIPINPEFVQKTFLPFSNVYNNNIYPIENFFLSQTRINYNIQQRVSLMLNSLEGIIKRRLEKKDKIIPINKNQRKIILDAVKDNAINYVNSEEFKSLLAENDISSDLLIEERISNSLGRFSELSFDETLELSKTINKIGLDFVRSIKPMPTKFWKRCKDHRNFHAHLTEDNHKGFNGVQSVYAIFILSNYFRLLVLELSNATDFETKKLDTEASYINEWIKTNNLISDINNIK